MKSSRDEFIQKNSPCGGFLQSDYWLKFQNDFGIKNHNISDKNFWSNILEYELPLVGRYFYIPRGPVKEQGMEASELNRIIADLISLAKINKAGWIRIDNFDKDTQRVFRKNNFKIVKAPHDMQPRQIFVLNIKKDEEVVFSEMKPKTRYNIGLAIKKGVEIKVVDKFKKNQKEVNSFLRLIRKTENRKKVHFHPKEYYKKMFKNIDKEIIKLYLAMYKGKIIAGAILISYGKMATYLHGASDDRSKNVMAPFLLQWQMIKDAKKMGAEFYDFGGVSINDCDKKRELHWSGVTRFKQGFSKNAKPVEFSGSYDIIVNPFKYWLYRIIQKVKSIF